MIDKPAIVRELEAQLIDGKLPVGAIAECARRHGCHKAEARNVWVNRVTDMITVERAYAIGREARANGALQCNNPFMADHLRDAWANGWSREEAA